MARFLLIFVFVACFSLATSLQPHFEKLGAQRSNSILSAFMGDSRRLFANHFFAKADAYFHSGYYPTIFDQPKKRERSPIESSAHEKPEEHGKEHAERDDAALDFLGQPRDWIERFGRHFFPVTHSHLEKNGDEREILPWLKLSAEMDPQRVETYVSAAYWLRTRLGKPDEAEKFLRDGLRENPDSPEILLELGCIYDQTKKNPAVARNLWMLARQKWLKQFREAETHAQPDLLVLEDILDRLTGLEEREQHWPQVLFYLEELKRISPNKEVIDRDIAVVKAKMASVNSPGRQ
jgi:tetratricopeptide (TPR) repeat protein